MIEFTALDWLWVWVYIVLILIFGILFTKRAGKSSSEFFIADRKLPAIFPALSVFATHFASDTPMWFSGCMYPHGLRGLWYGFFPAWCSTSAFSSTRVFRRTAVFTQAEYMTQRFGGMGSELVRGWIAGWQTFMNMFVLGWVGVAMGKVCTYLFEWPLWYGLVLFSTFCAIYTLTSGYWGVVVTDTVQAVMQWFAIIAVSVVGVIAVGGIGGLIDGLNAQGLGWMLNPFAFTGIVSGQFPLLWWITMLLFTIVGGLGMGIHCDWYVEAQRIQSARTVKDASYSMWSGSVMVLLRNAVWALAILCFIVLCPGIASSAEYEMGWFRVGFEYLPVGMVGFFFACIVAIHFSTIDTHLNLSVMYATRDLYNHYINPKATEKQIVLVGRVVTAIVLVGSFFFGLMIGDNILKWLVFTMWIMLAGIWLPNILQVLWWRVNSWGYLSAWMLNLVLSWLVVWILPTRALADYLQFWILMIVVGVIFLVITFLTKPEDMDTLTRFYTMAHPPGFWGPVKKETERRLKESEVGL